MRIRFAVAAFLLLLFFSLAAAEQEPTPLPPIVMTHLKTVEETYRVLDIVSEKIWPGWTDYRDVPFLFEYENGLRVLIGHPNPPKEFQPVSDLRVGKNLVFVDRSELVAKELIPPLAAGGGPINFGATVDNLPVRVISMRFLPPGQLDLGDDEPPHSAEEQILIFVHELFHCFQRSHIKNPIYGNLQFNADANYALYSEIEGRALNLAYAEPNPEKAKAYARDFLVARSLKRTSMSDSQTKQESGDEFNEGTATYAEVRALELLRTADFSPTLTSDDASYQGFKNAETLLRRYVGRLTRASAGIDYPYGKSYTYGCFQALLNDRLFPDWKESLFKASGFMDTELGVQLAITPEERRRIEQSIQRKYPVTEIRVRHAIYLSARDDAYRKLKDAAGIAYVIDFKPTHQYLSTIAPKKGSYSLGFNQLYPNGLPPLEFDDVKLSGIRAPVEIDQIYYIRTIYEVHHKSGRLVVVKGLKQSDGSWKNAIVRTPLFTLNAPHVRIHEIGRLVKIQVISRVK
jgi:hypothetical protein